MLSLEDTDLEFDIDSELQDDEYAHALPFCYKHKGPEWYPVPGTIAQVLCGRLIRIKNEASPDKKKCDECKHFHGKTNCYVCGQEVYRRV